MTQLNSATKHEFEIVIFRYSFYYMHIGRDPSYNKLPMLTFHPCVYYSQMFSSMLLLSPTLLPV